MAWKTLLAAILLAPFALATGSQKPRDVWQPFRYFVGRWQGDSKGKPGFSRVREEFKFVLGGSFLEASGRGVYPPQAANPKGQTYEGFDIIGYDRTRRTFVLRQFNSEGFVNEYVLDRLAPDGKTIVFVSERMSGLPPGFRARKTYRIDAPNRFEDVFELAPPGRELEPYVQTLLTRKK